MNDAALVDLPRTIAHRGLSAHAPENTLAAVRAASDAGCHWVELDVQLLGDGTPVVWHDAGVRRCSDGRGRLRKLTHEQVCRLDVGGWFGKRYRGERIATLDAMLSLIDALGMGLNLELKVSRGHDPAALASAALPALLAALPPARLLVSSFHHDALLAARSVEPDPARLPLGILYKYIPDHWQREVEQLSAFSLHVDWRKLKETRAREIKTSGTRLLCYTVNDARVAQRLWQWGVDSLISDDPSCLAQPTAAAG
ncbi:glycerophosphodiester phosphodiesterase family protein [Halomonas sp. WWR20]